MLVYSDSRNVNYQVFVPSGVLICTKHFLARVSTQIRVGSVTIDIITFMRSCLKAVLMSLIAVVLSYVYSKQPIFGLTQE